MKQINDIAQIKRELISKEIDYRNAIKISGDRNEAKKLQEEINATHLKLRMALINHDKNSTGQIYL